MRGGGAYGTSRGLVGGRVGVSRMDSFLAGTITPRQSARDPAEVEWAYLLLVQDRLAWVGFPPRMVLAMPKDVVLDAVLGGSVEIVMWRACVRELFARRQPRSTIKQ